MLPSRIVHAFLPLRAQRLGCTGSEYITHMGPGSSKKNPVPEEIQQPLVEAEQRVLSATRVSNTYMCVLRRAWQEQDA